MYPELPGGDRGSSPPLPPSTPQTPAIRGLGPPPGTPRLYFESKRAAEKLIFFFRKRRVNAGEILVNLKNLA